MGLANELQYHCNPRSLARARQIAASSKNILTKQVRYDGEEAVISAFVASSSGWDDRYRTSVTIGEDDTIVDYSCTCPAYIQYDGMCKHCAALVMEFDTQPQTFLGYSEHRAPATSACITEFMRKAELAAATDAASGDENAPTPVSGSIGIETIVAYGYRSWSAHFKVVGPQASYAMKSVSEFVEHMRTGEFFSYGKKLAFTHVPALLNDSARDLLRFLERACDLREQTSAAAYWRYRSANVVGRDLELSETEAVELFDLLAQQARPFALELADLPGKRIVQTSIVDGDPIIPIVIRPYDKGGYLIERDGNLAIAAQGGRMYLWRGNDASSHSGGDRSSDGGGTLYRCSREFSRCAGFLRTVYDSDNERLFVSKQDMPLFCATVLPLIESTLQLQAPQELEAFKPVPCELEFFFDKSDDFVTCDAWAIYRNQRFLLRGTGLHTKGADDTGIGNAGGITESDDVEPLRDERKEQRATNLVDRYFSPDYLSGNEPGERTARAIAAHGKRVGKRSIAGQDAAANASQATARTGGSIAVIPLDDEEDVARLLFGGLAEFRAQGDVFTTPAFDRLISDKKPKVTLGVSLAGNLIDLTISADDLPKHELSALLGSYRKRKRFHKLKSGAYLDLQGFDLSQLDRLASDLGITAKQLAAGHVELPTYRAFYLDEEADLERDRSFSRYLENFRTADEAAYEPPATLANVLRPYQEEGFRWLSARCDAGFGGILADEMGLGKSVQLISLLLDRRDETRAIGPSLIVCPASLVYNWLAEFERFAPELAVRAVAGDKHERARMRRKAFASPFARNKRIAGSEGSGLANGPVQTDAAAQAGTAAQADPSARADAAANPAIDVLVTSYDLLRIDINDYEGRAFYCCALDEAQYIKNPGTLTTRAAKHIEAHHRFALTGTPLENRLSELWSIFDFLMPGLLGPYARFRDRFEEPIIGGDETAAGRLQAAVSPFMLRRLKKDVLADLPEKLESVVYVPLEGEQQKLYAAHEQQLRESLTTQHNTRKERDAGQRKVEILAELTKLRQLCCDPGLLYENYAGGAAKLDAIMELVEAAQDAGEKTLVFSQFTSFLSRIADRLDAQGTSYFTITGATPKKRRLQLVNTFNEDDTPVFLISLKAGGTGLNLIGASVVVHADPWWNEAAQAQATDRAHRIGQTRMVSVQKVIAKGTIEERILKLQQAKSDLARQIVGAGSVSLATLSPEDLATLLQDD